MCKVRERLIDKEHGLIKSQPPDENHTRLAAEVINEWKDFIPEGRVLDIGCGQGFCKPLFEAIGHEWHGVALGKDYEIIHAKYPGLVSESDMHDLDVPYTSFSLIFARHVLEHSPFPVIALREWGEATDTAIVVVPKQSLFADEIAGHLSVFRSCTWRKYFEFTGWTVEKHKTVFYKHHRPSGEFRFLLKR